MWEIDRMKVKQQQMILRGVWCEICSKDTAHDLHEIFARSLTVGNDEARYWSYNPELCSLLCRDCHSKAHNPEKQQVLIKKNIQLFGYERVHYKYVKLQSAMKNQIAFNFPARFECH